MGKVKIFAIGDPHFKEKYLAVSEQFVNLTVETIKANPPDFVVVLGDLLDTMNIVRTQSHKLAVRFLKELGKISKTFLVIGNHDLINNTQFLTDNHIFTPFHGVEELTNVHIVDKPYEYKVKGFSFVFCPYVPPGRFIEALDTNDKVQWKNADCIFAHQEFKGAHMGAIVSETGDEWPEDYPMVVSGHIHDSQIVGSNIYYTGSAMQHSFAETTKKGIWILEFVSSKKGIQFSYEILPNFLKAKSTVTLSVEDLKEFSIPDQDPLQELRICIEDTSSNLESFQKTKQIQNLERQGIKVVLRTTSDENNNLVKGKGSFWENFNKLIEENPDANEMIKKYIT